MATDQEIRDAGLLYIPKQKYLQNPYNLPVEETPPPPDGGITNTNAFANSGNDGFSVYNPDPNSIVNRNADSTRYNNLMENSYLKGGSNSTDPRYLTERYNPSITRDQSRYNLATSNNAMTPMTPERRAEIMRDTNNRIQDNRQTYGAQGQYETLPSEFAYNSQTELDKFKDNYPEYFDLNQSGPKTGIPGLIEKYMTNSFVGKGVGMAKDFLGNMLPTNRRAMLENQLGARGVMVNDIGQIVQGDGNYNTAENIMAGYNANKVTQKTIDKRKETINKSLGKFDKYDKSSSKFDQDKYNQMQDKLKALDEFSTINNLSQKESDFMYDETEEEKNKKKKKGNIITRFLNKKKETKAAADAKTAKEAKEAQAAVTMQTNNFVPPSGITGGGTAYDYDGRSNEYGIHDSTISAPQAQTNQESYRGGNNGSNSVSAGSGGGASYSNSAQTGAKDGFGYGLKEGGRAGYFFGGRVNYKIGGRVGFKNGGLASIL